MFMRKISNGIRTIWQTYFGRSFMKKMFLTYAGITVLTGLMLFLTLGENLTTIKYDQAMIMSDQCLTVVDTYLNQKIENASSFHKRFFQQKDTWNAIMQKLEQSEDSVSVVEQQDIRTTIFYTMYGIDDSYKGMLLVDALDGQIYHYGNDDASIEKVCFQKWMEQEHTEEGQNRLFAVRLQENIGNVFPVFVIANVKSADYKSTIGYMAFYFNAKKIQQSYQAYEKYLKGNLYVLDENGEMLFDSKADYAMQEEISREELLIKKNGQKTIGNWICNIVYSKEYGYYVVNVFSTDEIKEDVKIPQRTMAFIVSIALLVGLVFHYMSTLLFERRLEPITETIHQVRKGNLTSFPIQKNYQDEIGDIYAELLRMCTSLDEHIQREYVYKLRQKEMELYALQTQIDPHFLYNSLEAIRMHLYMKGEQQAGRMIRILSDLFRNQMKQDNVVTNREELKYLHSYLELFEFRLGSKMQFEFDVKEEVYRYATIKHILQPIAENALVHGIEDDDRRKETYTIRIEGYLEDQDVVFVVRDDGCGIEEEQLLHIREMLRHDALFQKSIGIYNVSNRLRIVYGDSYRLQIESSKGEGTSVYVRIRAMKKKELEEYVQTINH